ncbi:MAG: hypothetical protein ACYDHY_18140 [Acidiferrobacterales bacterium]
MSVRCWEYLSDGILHIGEPVWHRCVRGALEAYSDAARHIDRERLRAYTRGMLGAWPNLPSFRLEAPPNWVWTPENGEALIDSLHKVDPSRIVARTTGHGPPMEAGLLRYLDRADSEGVAE